MKNKKSIFCVIVSMILVLGLSPSISAYDRYADYFSPEDVYENGGTMGPLFNEQPEYYNNIPGQSRTRAAGIPISSLAISTADNVKVYQSSNTASTQVGSLLSREIVKVQGTSGTFYYISYMNDTTASYGYVRQADIKAPSTSYSMPVTAGYCNNDYSSSHTGIDVAVASGNNVYATATGTVKYRISTGTVDGTLYLVNYGNAAFLDVGNLTFVYAHLSAFANGYTANTTLTSYRTREHGSPSHQYLNSNGTSVTKSASIGKTGNTGWSSAAHLHFEVRNGGNTQDPFAYVIFPNIGWRHC